MADFKISRIRYTWKGNWSAAATYIRDDVVRYGGSSFVCVRGHTADANFYTDVNYTVLGTSPAVPSPAWVSMTEGTAWRNTWATATQYNLGDVILSGGTAYLCTTPHTSGTYFWDGLGNWTAYLVGNNWLKDFTPNTRYRIGDLTRWEGIVYRCEVEHTSGSYLENTDINWSVYFNGKDYFSVWTTSTRYHANDLVKYGGSIWKCTAGHTSGAAFDLTKFSVELPGYQFGNDWNSITIYQPGDIIRRGGDLYYSLVLHQNVEPNNPNTGAAYWQVLAKGYNLRGDWLGTSTYNSGDVVRRGGELFLSLNKSEPDGSSLDYLDDSIWMKLVPGSEWQAIWLAGTSYRVGDVVFYVGGAYRCVFQHIATTQDFPGDNGSGFAYWETYIIPGSHTGITYRGDIPTYNLSRLPSGDGSTLDTTRVPIGTEDQLLMVNNSASAYYKKYGSQVQIRYVATSGVDRPDYGSHPFTPYRTIRYACEQVENLGGQVKIEIKTGVYTEILPIILTAGVAIKGEENRGVTIEPNAPIGALALDSTYTNLVLSRISDILEFIILGSNVIPSATIPSKQDKTTLGSQTGVNFVQQLIIDIKSYISFYIESTGLSPTLTGTNTATVNPGVLSTITAINNNVEFIADEAVAYMQTYYPLYVFDSALCKRDVRAYLTAIVYDLKYTGNYKSILAARYYKNAVLGSAGEDMFYVRDATGVRNVTMRGLIGTLNPQGVYDLYQRPTGGAYVSLDPGWGPNDSRTWITTRSFYVQNCATFGYGAIGAKVDGRLHNGGNKSIVANDFTQLISDGIGAWVIADGKTELVSVFTYYSQVGYLAELGGKIRATNGNNSYGKYGAVADGTDQYEIPRMAAVYNRNQQAVVAYAFAGEASDTVYLLEYSHAGSEYTNATYTVTGSGTFISLLQDDFRDSAIFQSRLTANAVGSNIAGGASYIRVENNPQGGNDYFIRLAAVDGNTFAQYNLTRLLITSGTGTGQYGTIIAYNNANKAALIAKESFTPIAITATSSTNNLITVASTVNLNPGTAIYVTGAAVGGVEINTLYYVISANFSGTKFAISSSLNGSAVTLSDVTGTTMQVYQAGWDHILPGTAIKTVLDTTSRYKIEPKPVFADPGFTTAVQTIDAANPINFSDVTFGETTETYNNLVGTLGTGSTVDPIVPAVATFNVVKLGRSYTVTINTSGAGYVVGDKITILGTSLGGAAPANNLTITVATTSDDSTDSILTITYSGKAASGKWTAVSTGGSTAAKYSSDGATWVDALLPGTYNWTSVAAGNNRFVAITSGASGLTGSQAAYSLTGKTWIGDDQAPFAAAAITLPSIANWTKVQYGGSTGKFIAIAAGSSATASTTTGLTWSSSGTLPSAASWSGLTYGAGNWVAVAGATQLTGVRMMNTAGQFVWNSASVIPTVNATVTVTGTATGSGSITGYTNTPVTYYVTAVTTSVTLSNVVVAGITGQFTCDASTMVVGNTITISGTNSGLGAIISYANPTTYVISATNGSTSFTLINTDGSAVSTNNISGNTLTGLTFVTGKTMTLSATQGGSALTTTAGTTTGLLFQLGSTAAAYSSDNGITWTAATLPASACWTSVAYGNNRFVAISASQSLAAYSLNGTTWTVSAMPTSDGVTPLQWNKIRYGQGVFFAVAQEYTSLTTTTVAATSQFGLNWNRRTLPTALAWTGIAFGNPNNVGTWVAVGANSSVSATILTGARALGRITAASGIISDIKLWDPGSGYTTPTISATAMVAGNHYTIVSAGNTIFTNYGAQANTPGLGFYATGPASGSGIVVADVTLTIVDPNKSTQALMTNRLGNGVLAQPTFLNRGAGYKTSSTIVTVAGDGYADIYPAGSTITINGMSVYPRPGAQLRFAGNSQLYTVSIQTKLGYTANGGFMSQFKITPKLNINTGPANGTAVEIREKYSQCRITGHDFLDIGTGNYVQTNYPALYAGNNYIFKSPENEVHEEQGGRVFYTSTDQDGNFRTGELFSVEQATGIVTLSADYFNLSGLTELKLGGVRLGGSGVVIREFSSDASFIEDSNNIIPTQHAIKTYITNRLSQGGQDVQTTTLNAGVTSFGPKSISTTTNIKENVAIRMNFQRNPTGYMLATRVFMASFAETGVMK